MVAQARTPFPLVDRSALAVRLKLTVTNLTARRRSECRSDVQADSLDSDLRTDARPGPSAGGYYVVRRPK
jgi:hypothetical protein